MTARREGVQLAGVDRFLDLLRMGNLLRRIPDKQRHTADDDGRSGHPQQAVGVGVVKRGQLHVVHELHRTGGTAQVQRARRDHSLDDGEHQRTAQALQHQRNCRYRTDLVEADASDRRQSQRDDGHADANPADDDRHDQVGEVGHTTVHEK
ncbi:Uncharacterised protein [Mycobacterium tuberculosis]|nr:Uncharacterised protein [Mycobacterium tuberculosis]